MLRLKENQIIFLILCVCWLALDTTLLSFGSALSTITMDIHQVGGRSIPFGAVITPSEGSQLFFHFVSNTTTKYTCNIIKIDEDLFNVLVNHTIPVPIKIIGTIVTTNDCGVGTQGNIQYAQSFTSGFYVFEVIGIEADEASSSTVWIFKVIGGETGPGHPEDVT